MSLFDRLVDEALKNRQNLAPLRVAVEKELFHHDILRVMGKTGLLARLTFIGGTCLRECYGSKRLSEDLDFTGGIDFCRDSFLPITEALVESFKTRYGLCIEVGEPDCDTSNVDTWKIKVQTRPDHKHLPAQRINIDVCAIPSYEARPMVVMNPYGVEMGTSGLILQAQSREEIFADKLVAFALRPNRIQYRDVWDIAWLHQQGVEPRTALIPAKLKDRRREPQSFLQNFEERRLLMHIPETAAEFRQEMHRFLPADLLSQAVDQPAFWDYLTSLLDDLCAQTRRTLSGQTPESNFHL